jgi:alpha-glucosidase
VDVRVAAAPLEKEAQSPTTDWWREAVIYQVYTRSFADATGDGVGDLAGVRERLPYLRELGIDGLWFNPWYPSPGADNGYDISDYRSIDPALGTLHEAEGLIADARALGIRTIVDVVPNHVSDQHPWFRAALGSPPGSHERARFWFRPGLGANGDEPPNQWQSIFGGNAWTRVDDGEWYLHLFAPEQPDLNWTHRDVWAEYESVLRFWFDRGAAGVRIDSAALLVKDAELRDERPDAGPGEHPFSDRDETHDVYRHWRTVADSYADPRVLVGEIWLPDPDRLARYLRPDELHTAFNFDFLLAPWAAEPMRESIAATLRAHAAVGAPPVWVLSNHDTVREVSRYARPQGVRALRRLSDLLDLPADFALGVRRARAAALLMLALPGAACVYQGEELGLSEVEDLPDEVLQDPGWEQSGHADRGRDGCRVPIPWSGLASPFAFSPPGASAPPWLPQPASWRELSVEAQSGDDRSTLELYRRALRLRRDLPALGDGSLRWLRTPPGTLAFARDPGFGCVVNFSADPVALPRGAGVLIASGPLTANDRIPPDTAAWLALRESTARDDAGA